MYFRKKENNTTLLKLQWTVQAWTRVRRGSDQRCCNLCSHPENYIIVLSFFLFCFFFKFCAGLNSACGQPGGMLQRENPACSPSLQTRYINRQLEEKKKEKDKRRAGNKIQKVEGLSFLYM